MFRSRTHIVLAVLTATTTFDRAAEGSLTLQHAYATNGTGTGAGLGSQGVLTLEGEHLFAVNASSNSISAFKVRDHDLLLEATVASGGTIPISAQCTILCCTS